MNIRFNQLSLIVCFALFTLSHNILNAQNPTYLVETFGTVDGKTTPCQVIWDPVGSPQHYVGHDFTNVLFNKSEGVLEFDANTNENNHAPMYYMLNRGDSEDCFPGEGLVDLSDSTHNKMRIKIKATTPMTVNCYIQEGNNPSWNYSKFSKYFLSMNLTTEYQTFQILNFSSDGFSGEQIDLSQIGALVFELGKSDGVNYDEVSEEKISIDYIEFGSFIHNDSTTGNSPNPTYLIETFGTVDDKTTPCQLEKDSAATPRYHNGRDFANLFFNTSEGTLDFHANTHETEHLPMYYKLNRGDLEECQPGKGLVDLSDSTYNKMRIKIKASTPMSLNCYIQEGNTPSWNYSRYSKSFIKMNLTTEYQTFYLENISSQGIGNNYNIDLSQIGALVFELGKSDGVNYDFVSGEKVSIDYIEFGSFIHDDSTTAVIKVDTCLGFSSEIFESSQINCQSFYSILNAKAEGGNAPFLYNWSQQGKSSNNETFKTVTTGAAQLILTDQIGCSDTSLYDVSEHNGGNQIDSLVYRENFNLEGNLTSPCYLDWDSAGAFQGAVGHDFNNMMWDQEKGEMFFSATTHPQQHGPLYYTLTGPSLDGDCFPAQGIADISQNPSFEIRMRASKPMQIRCYFQEGNAPSWNYSRFSKTYLEMNLTTEYQTFYIGDISSKNFQTNFFSSAVNPIDLSQIGGLAFELGKSDGVNYDQLIDEKVYIDYFQFGGNCVLDTCNNLGANYEVIEHFSCQNNYSIINAKGSMGKPSYSYEWLGNQELINDSTIKVTDSGFYDLVVSDTENCADTTSVYVPENPFGQGIDLEPFFLNSEFRTGFTRTNLLQLINRGCDNAEGEIYIVLDQLTEHSYAFETPDRVNGDTIFWSFSNLRADTNDFKFSFDIETSVWAAIGDTVCFTIGVNYDGYDEIEDNNSKTFCFPIINGYDPNDIAVHPSSCAEGYVLNSDVLTYKIRFQNTGNAEAININVMDTLDSNIDVSTFELIGTSHPEVLKTFLLNDSVLHFAFDEIWLKDSMNHEPESHGHVIYQVRQKESLAEGTEIYNKADIYFDYNPAVVTNTVISTIIDDIPECEPIINGQYDLTVRSGVVYPNPNNGLFSISFDQIITNGSLELYNMEGKSVYQKQVSGGLNFDVCTQLSKGVYFIKLVSDDYIGESKFIVR